MAKKTYYGEEADIISSADYKRAMASLKGKRFEGLLVPTPSFGKPKKKRGTVL